MMNLRALLLTVACILLCSSIRAADQGRGGEIIGNWAVTADSLKDRTYTLTIERDGATSIKSHVKKAGSESSSSSSGPMCVYANGKLTFNGDAEVDGFKIAG